MGQTVGPGGAITSLVRGPGGPGGAITSLLSTLKDTLASYHNRYPEIFLPSFFN